MSMNTGLAPTFTIASVVETKVCPTVHTVSHSSIPKALRAHTKAFVPDPIAAQSSAPVYLHMACSNLLTVGPVIKSFFCIMPRIALSIFDCNSSYCG